MVSRLCSCFARRTLMWPCCAVREGRTLAEVSAKERLAGLPAPCTAALRCVPFVLPRQWVESPALMAEELAMYTIHVEPSVHEVCDCSCTPGIFIFNLSHWVQY